MLTQLFIDTESERVVQQALDKLMTSRQTDKYQKRMTTTIVIAHRLQTIRKADCIVVMKPLTSSGQQQEIIDTNIIESGTHDELMNIEDGHYRQMVLSAESGFSSDQGVILPDS